MAKVYIINCKKKKSLASAEILKVLFVIFISENNFISEILFFKDIFEHLFYIMNCLSYYSSLSGANI